MILYWVLLLVTAAISYLIGGLSTLVLASNFIFHKNLRRLGRGNLFISNFRRIYGIKGAALLLLVEIVKDVIPLVIGGILLGIKGHADVGRAFAGFCMVLGRCWPVYYRFRGSGAILCLAVSGIFQSVPLGIATVAFFGVFIWLTKRLSLATFLAGLGFAAFAVITVDGGILLVLVELTAVLVLIKQIPALVRIKQGREEKLNFKEDLSYKFEEKF